MPLALMLSAGAAAGDSLGPAWCGVLLALAALLLVAAGWSRRPMRALGFAALAIGAAARGAESRAYEAAPLRATAAAAGEDGPLRLEGELRGDVREGERRSFLLDVEGLGRARVVVDGAAPWPPLRDGDRVAVWATLGLPRGFGTPGAFDSVGQAVRDGVHALGHCKSPALLTREGHASLGPLREGSGRARAWARARLRAAVPPGDEQAVLRAMVVGDRAALDRGAAESFRRAGTYHVLAISGAQVAIVVGLLLWASRRAGAAPVATAVLVSAAAVFYAALVGGDVPVVRAAFTAVVVVWGRAFDLDADLANLLGLAAAAILVRQPSAVGDVGFQLTFAATLGIVLWTRGVAARLPLVVPASSRRGRLAAAVRLALAASLCAQAALLPLLVWHFHRIAPAALALNLVAVPLSGAVLGAGVLAVVLGPVPLLGAWTARAAWGVAHLLLLSSDPGGVVSRLDLRLPDPPLAAALLYAAALVAWGRGSRRAPALVAAGLVALVAGAQRTADGRLAITVLDVGQGDSIVVRTPGGHRVVVDAGGTRGGSLDVGESVVAPFLWTEGVRGLDALVLTHAHPDHVGGAPALLRAFPIGQAWQGPAPAADPGYAALDAALRASAVPRLSLGRGARARWDGVEVEVLAPRGRALQPWTARNDDSLVLRLTYGTVRILLAGDAEAAEEAALGPVGADVVKVPHHGSRTSSTPGLVRGTGARVALVSCGYRNHFGHPHPEVALRWQVSGARLLRTDQDGSLTIATDGKRLWLRTFASPGEVLLP